MIDFSIPADLAAERDRIRRFVTEKIVPFERDPRLTAHGPTDELRQEMVELARAEKLLTIQAPEALGGRGQIGRASCRERGEIRGGGVSSKGRSKGDR